MPDLDALIRAELDYEPGTAAAWTRNNALRAVLDLAGMYDVAADTEVRSDRLLLGAVADEIRARIAEALGVSDD